VYFLAGLLADKNSRHAVFIIYFQDPPNFKRIYIKYIDFQHIDRNIFPSFPGFCNLLEMCYLSVGLYNNFLPIFFVSSYQRVFDRHFNNEIFLLVFICVSLQPRIAALDRFTENCLKVLFIDDPEI